MLKEILHTGDSEKLQQYIKTKKTYRKEILCNMSPVTNGHSHSRRQTPPIRGSETHQLCIVGYFAKTGTILCTQKPNFLYKNPPKHSPCTSGSPLMALTVLVTHRNTDISLIDLIHLVAYSVKNLNSTYKKNHSVEDF